jgi:hypothetical protein
MDLLLLLLLLRGGSQYCAQQPSAGRLLLLLLLSVCHTPDLPLHSPVPDVPRARSTSMHNSCTTHLAPTCKYNPVAPCC